jgi:hypothetical protein
MALRLKRLLGPPLMLAAAFVVVLCQVCLAQGDADLEAPGLEPFVTPSSHGATLFQNVRIFDGRGPTLSAPQMCWLEAIPLSAYPQARSPSIRMPMSDLSQRRGVC